MNWLPSTRRGSSGKVGCPDYSAAEPGCQNTGRLSDGLIIRPAANSDLRAMRELFCRVTQGVIQGFPPSEHEFEGAFGLAAAHLARQEVWLASVEDRIVGFIRLGIYKPTGGWWTLAEERDGMLIGPIVAPGEGVAATALVEEGICRLRALGAQCVWAFDPGESPGMRFYNGGWSGLSESLPQSAQALAAAGFHIRHRELHFTLPATHPVRLAEPPAHLDLRWSRREEDRFTVRAFERSAELGACYFSRMYPSRTRADEARRWGFIDGLGVREAYRGRGLGRLLLTQALCRLRREGCGQIGLTTASGNLVAQNLYYSLGFEPAGSSLTLHRSL